MQMFPRAYIPVAVDFERIRPSLDLTCLHERAVVRWSISVDGKTRLGLSRVLPEDELQHYPHEVIPALEDIAAIEEDGERTQGEEALINANTTGIHILHGMGYSTDYGVRTVTVIQPMEGIATSEDVKLEDDTGQRISIFGNKREKDYRHLALWNRIGAAVQEITDEVLRKHPQTYFFLHHVGDHIDLDYIKRVMKHPKEYHFVEFPEDDVSVPLRQRANVQLILTEEQKARADPRHAYQRLYSYTQEEDQRSYNVYTGGKLIGSNNRRGMHRHLKDVLKPHKKETVLVHGAGLPLDFELVDKILTEDPDRYHIERASIRFPGETLSSANS